MRRKCFNANMLCEIYYYFQRGLGVIDRTVSGKQNIHHLAYQTSSSSESFSYVSLPLGGRAVGGVPCRDSTRADDSTRRSTCEGSAAAGPSLPVVVLLCVFFVRGVLSCRSRRLRSFRRLRLSVCSAGAKIKSSSEWFIMLSSRSLGKLETRALPTSEY